MTRQYSGGVRAENVLKRSQALTAKFVTVAQEQGAAELPCVSNALEQVNGDELLARARRQ